METSQRPHRDLTGSSAFTDGLRLIFGAIGPGSIGHSQSYLRKITNEIVLIIFIS